MEQDLDDGGGGKREQTKCRSTVCVGRFDEDAERRELLFFCTIVVLT